MQYDPLIFLDPAALDRLVAQARSSPRRRQNLNLHRDLADPIQRFLNAGDPGSYVRPHRHAAQRWELFAMLRGRIDVVAFADDGTVIERRPLIAERGGVVEIPGGRWHSFAFMAPGSVALELKPGPYDAATDKEFARWAPAEGDQGASACARWLATATPGRRFLP